jgi:Cellulase (glycosyl hydrolase family 5)
MRWAVAAVAACLAAAVVAVLTLGGSAKPRPPTQAVHRHGAPRTSLRVSARDMPCPSSTARTCAALVDASGNVVHMHGVDLSGTEYACIQNFGIFSGAQNTQADIDTMLDWHINFVRIQLNEDCWLGVNVGGINSSYVDTSPGVGAYATAIEDFVKLLHSNGIYTEIVDMWNAPGKDRAVGQSGSSGSFQRGAYYGPDEDHSAAMWASMARAFANDSMTILSPAGEENVSMACQMHGCSNEGKAPNNADGLGGCGTGCHYYRVAGLSQAVQVMRSGGFKGPIALECAGFGGTCDEGSGASWLAEKPNDSLSPSQIMAEVHNYGSGSCTTSSCWKSQYLPILQAGYPLFYGELGEGINAGCTDTYLPQATSWADAYAVGYMNWTWTVGTHDCYALLTSYTTGATPTVASFTGTTTSGSTAITGVSSTKGLAPGQVVIGSGLPAGDTIVSIRGSALTMGLESTASASRVSLSAKQGDAGWIKAHDQSFVNPAAMTNISRGQPAHGYAGHGGAVGPYAASWATDDIYQKDSVNGPTHAYDCTAPCGLAVDLSGVPASERHKVVIAWYGNSAWDPGSTGKTGFGLYDAPGNYTIDTNTAAGGSVPTLGWKTIQTVTNNQVAARVATLDLSGANWVRINVTSPSSNDQSGNTDAVFKFDVLSDNDAGAPTDTWLFLGDSVTQNSMSRQDVDAADACCFKTDFMQSLHRAEPTYYPTEINAGIASWPSENELESNSVTGESFFQDVAKYYGGHYVAVDYGGTNTVNGDCNSYLADESTMIAGLVSHGYQPVVRYSVTWAPGFSTSQLATAAQLNQLVHGPALPSGVCGSDGDTFLFMTYPTVVVGPDFYNFFETNQSLANGPGGVHPTHPAGENAYRQLYVQAALWGAHGG